MFFKNKLLKRINENIADCEQRIKDMEKRITPETQLYYREWIANVRGEKNALEGLKMDIILGKI